MRKIIRATPVKIKSDSRSAFVDIHSPLRPNLFASSAAAFGFDVLIEFCFLRYIFLATE